MANPVFCLVEGTTQGPISQGACTEESVGNMAVEDHADEIRVVELKHNVFLPKDPQSGQPTGQRIHEALTVTKLMDKSSPLLYNALASGETLTKVVFQFYRTSSAGQLEHYFTIALENAIVVGMRAVMPDILDPKYQQYGQMEEVSFSFATITWTHEVAGTESSDTFRVANA